MQWVYPTLAFDVEPREVAEFVTADSWHYEPSLVWDVKRWQYLYPSFWTDERYFPSELITADKWHPESNKPVWDVRRQQYTYTWQVTDEKYLLSELITADKWHPESNRPVWDVRRQQYTYEWLSFDPEPREVAELITADSWHHEPTFIWGVKQWQHLYPSFWTDERYLPSELITVDKWHPESNKPVWDVRRQQYTYTWQVTDEKYLLSELITADKWHPESNRPVWDVRRQQYTYEWLSFDPEPREVAELITADSWHHEPTFIWSVKRWQHLYPTAIDDEAMFINPGVEVCGIHGSPFLFTAANWGVVTWYLQTYLRAGVGTVKAKLFDITAAADVAGSIITTSSVVLVRLRSGPLTLTDGHEYMIKFCRTGGSSGSFIDGRLIAI
jgi:hypothetical protein